MNPIITAATLGLVLGGCSGILGPRGAPTCDGLSRRPLNRSMWDWDVAAPSRGTLGLASIGRARASRTAWSRSLAGEPEPRAETRSRRRPCPLRRCCLNPVLRGETGHG